MAKIDRISILPNGVREHILSFLTAQDAVRTTVLARRWRDVWTRSPSLRFIGDMDRESVGRISNFVDHLLDVRLRGAFPAPWIPVRLTSICSTPSATIWTGKTGTKAAAKCCFVSSAMSIWSLWPTRRRSTGGSSAWCAHESASACDRIDHIYRDHSILGLADQRLVTEHLIQLELAGVRMFDGFLDLSRCPALLELKIENCLVTAEKIQCPSLRHLSIIDSNFSSGYHTKVSLPGLITLRWIQCSGMAPLLEPMQSLTTAIVTSELTSWLSEDPVDGMLPYALLDATELKLSVPRDMIRYSKTTVFIFYFFAVHESSEQEEQQQQSEEVPFAHGLDKVGSGEEEALGASGSGGLQTMWQRGPPQLPKRLILVEKRPLVRPTWKKFFVQETLPWPFGMNQEPAYTWEHYKHFPDFPDREGRVFATLVYWVVGELWDFFRVEPEYMEQARNQAYNTCPKLITDMIYEAQLWDKMEAKLEPKIHEERLRWEGIMAQQMSAMFTYMQSTGAPPLHPGLFPGLHPFLVPPPYVTPQGTPNQSVGSNNLTTSPPNAWSPWHTHPRPS
ncbi:hypothetical protein PR202_gb16260 [Eleusine coracana subsp. coracana]|uniref:F-box domain-containing protein n=1 Tax=Eleusine coracana subsp. coracana TaxID=191504 RepID=A0AAV5F017_ELECO|nr:hypothetical protein PR202_gb16260 [Eleusine coracana subsp. coracana]